MRMKILKLFAVFILLLIVGGGLALGITLLLGVELFPAFMFTLRIFPAYLLGAILITGWLHTKYMYQEMKAATLISISIFYLLCATIFFGWTSFIYDYDNNFQRLYYSEGDISEGTTDDDLVLEYVFQRDKNILTSQNGATAYYWTLSWQDNNNMSQHINITIPRKKHMNNERHIELLDNKKIHPTTLRHTRGNALPVLDMGDNASTYDVEYPSLSISDYGVVMNTFRSDSFAEMEAGDKLFIQIVISLLLATVVFLIGVTPSKTIFFFMIYCLRFIHLFVIYRYVSNKEILLIYTIGIILVMYLILLRRLLRIRKAGNTIPISEGADAYTVGEYE